MQFSYLNVLFSIHNSEFSYDQVSDSFHQQQTFPTPDIENSHPLMREKLAK